MNNEFNEQILIVEDDPEVLHIIEEVFVNDGFSVLTAKDGETALNLIDCHNCPVIFLDLQLPGISGIELCEVIRTKFPLVNIFAITGHHSLFELSHARMAGFDDYFFKPADMSILLKAARDACDRIHRWKKGSNAAA